MTISNRQFELLNAMNIPLWVSKQSNTIPVIKTTEEEKKESHLITKEQLTSYKPAKTANNLVVNLEPLIEKPLFNDILVSMGLSSTQAVSDTHTENSVNLGVINWQFSDKNIISFTNNLLITPYLQVLEKSPQLKRQLWQLIIDKELICP